VSDWKERMKRIKAANEGKSSSRRSPRKRTKSGVLHPSRVHARLNRKEGKKEVITQIVLCDMCGKKVARRSINNIGAMRLCSKCKEAKR